MSEGEPTPNSEQSSKGDSPIFEQLKKEMFESKPFDDSLFNAPMPRASQNSEPMKSDKLDNQPTTDTHSDNADNLPVPADHFNKYLAQEYVGILTTQEMKALEGKTEQEIDYYVKVGAFGKGITDSRKLTDEMWSRIKNDPELRPIMGEMKRAGAGSVIDKRPELADKLMAAFYGESVDEKKPRSEFAGVKANVDLAAVDTLNLPGRIVGFFGMKHRAKMKAFDEERAAILADDEFSEEERQAEWEALNKEQAEYQEKYGRRAKYKLIGATVVGVVAGGVLAYMRVQHAWGDGGGGNKSGATDQAKNHFENNRVTHAEDHGIPDRINDLFKVPDPAKSADRLHPHDFNHPIPNGNDPVAFKKALDEQLRGNGVEMARYLSKAKVEGAPLREQFQNQGDYERAITDYGHKLSGDHRLYAQQVEAFNIKLNDPRTTFEVRPLKAYGSDFIENGEYHWDPSVDRGVANGDVTIIHFNDGQTPDIWVRNQCGQTVEELKEAVVRHVSKPGYQQRSGPEYLTVDKPHSSSLPHRDTPPSSPPPPSGPPPVSPPPPPSGPPEVPQPPHFGKSGPTPGPADGTYAPAPEQRGPAKATPDHVAQSDAGTGASSSAAPGTEHGSGSSSGTGSSGSAASAGESGSHSGDQGAPG
jgi:hypothetical protein